MGYQVLGHDAERVELSPDPLASEDQRPDRPQAAHTAARQEASHGLKTILAEGQRLATGLRKLITIHSGASSEKLVEPDMQPFRSRKRKVAPGRDPGSSHPGVMTVLPADRSC